ncbi:hypothetical protein ID866_4406 [Astraeus odoratus]|nr:hypothetical protein ID866_4406 [Astraeus odoratus]
MMLKLRLIGLTLLAFSAATAVHAEEKRYVSDELNTWVRSGPGDNYRLVGTVNAGEEVTLLQTNAETNYGQVRDSSGRTSWIPMKELSTVPSLRTRVPDLENQVKTLTDKLNNIDGTWNQRTAEMQQKVAQSDGVINGLKEENQKLKNELIVAQKKVNAANLQLDDKQRTIIMQWFILTYHSGKEKTGELGVKSYLVGGAVRDALLGLPVKDKDWVVVGATPEEMLDAGYQQVGRDFPVFLHPKSREEYALARTERKSGSGYTGFTCYAAPDVTLEQDLLRRDLTINALAQDENGHIIDAYGGQDDLRDRLLRHVSPAFSEDPLRVLRVARFAARYAHLSFRIADETMALMTAMTEAGELEHLTPERVWKETENALTTRNPQVFFQVLRDCGALKVLFPEIDALFGVPAPAKWHPEIDTGVHTLMTLSMAAMLSPEVDVRFSTLCHDLGKGLTPKEFWPRHHGHGPAGVKLVDGLCQRLRVPNDIRDLAKLVAEFHDLIHTFPILKPATIVKLFDNIDAWRKPQRVEQIALTSEADVRGRTGFEASDYPQGRLLREAWEVAKAVPTKDVVEAGFKGPEIREELTKRRIDAVTAWKEKRCPQPKE